VNSIVIIAPFESLARTAAAACERLGIDLPIYIGSMDDAVRNARLAEENGAEIIISRGTSAWKISSAGIKLPIVEIPVTGYDLLRAFMEAKRVGNKIGIADSPDILHGIRSLEEIFQCQIEQYPVLSVTDVEPAVKKLIDCGVDVLIGKWVYVQSVKNEKVATIVLSSGIESIIQAIHEANQVLEVKKAEAARSMQLRAILDFIADGVIAVDEEGRITVCNPAVENILQLPVHQLIGQRMDDVLTHFRVQQVLQSGKEELNFIQDYNGTKIISNRIPIRQGDQVIGVVSTFQELKKLQQQEQEIRKKLSHRGHVTKYRLTNVAGKSPVFVQAIEKVKSYSKVDSTILLSGETGVGKEVFAHLIHNFSPRAGGPFVAVNCAAIPENLLESELFGYVEGAFTGAKKGGKTGLFELAHGGTIFLDEIGELADLLQARLLRVLQEGEVMRLGDERVIPINVRVVAASNRDLEDMVQEGKFRADLFYRINILHIAVPSLRERKEDIPLMIEQFLQELGSTVQKDVSGFEPEALRIMQEYHWPGNIRQLRNFVERAMILAPGRWIDKDTVIEAGGKSFLASLPDQSIPRKAESNNLEDYELGHILRVLEQVDGNQTEAAKILGIGRTTLWRKLNKR
jgi:transcriptional regulator, propionate catabolism operon regulatory protein